MSEDLMGLLASASDEQIKAILAQREAAAKAVRDKAAVEVVEMGADFLNWLVTSQQFKRTETTGRWAVDFKTMPFVAENGTVYTVTLYVSDVAESEKGAVEAKVRKALADAAAKHKPTTDALAALDAK